MAKKKNKKAKKTMPMFPGMMPPVMPLPFDFSGDDEQKGAKAQEIKSNVKSACGKAIDMRKATVDTSMEQFSQFFSYMMDMQNGFAESIPEQLPTIPGMPAAPVSPKDIVKAIIEFEEMTNEFIVDQIDSNVAFFFDIQQKAIDQIPDAPQADAEEEKADEEEPAAEEAEAEAEDAE